MVDFLKMVGKLDELHGIIQVIWIDLEIHFRGISIDLVNFWRGVLWNVIFYNNLSCVGTGLINYLVPLSLGHLFLFQLDYMQVSIVVTFDIIEIEISTLTVMLFGYLTIWCALSLMSDISIITCLHSDVGS
jgi:hypothetical protein